MGGKAFFIYGPESSCTRLMRRIFIAAGCQGDGGLQQRFDEEGLPQAEDVPMIAWGRSVPGSTPRTYPRFREEWLAAHNNGYETQAIVMVRDWFCMIESQVKTDFKPAESLEQADGWTQDAYLRLFGALDYYAMPFVIVSFEALLQRPALFITKLMAHYGLTHPFDIENIYDPNLPYYEAI